MRLLSAAIFLALLAVTFPVGAASLPAAHQVDIPLGNGVLHAQLYKPDGDGPFPTVIALHGCGGLGGHSESIQPRYRDWAELLLKAGDAVLLPDSYGSRELGPQCRAKERPVRANRERVADIMASRQWLTQQPWAARAVDHLAAGRRRTDVVLGSDQQQRRNAGAPAQARRDAAVRIKGNRRAEIRLGGA